MSGAKGLAQMIATVAAWPLLVRYHVSCAILGRERAFGSMSERIARKPGMMGLYIRQAFYKRTLPSVGQDVHFGFMSLLSKTQATIGQRVYVGRFCTLGLVDLGDDVMLADAVQVLSGGRQHGTTSNEGQTLRDNDHTFTRVTIGQGAWIGAGAIIMADVGAGAIVGAGAVVTRPVPANTRVGGVPAKPLGTAASPSDSPAGEASNPTLTSAK